jgi:cytochrome b
MRLRFTFWLDVALLVVFCALETVPFTGLLLHEWIGLIAAVMVIIHLLLSWTWIATITCRFVSVQQGAATGRTRVNYLLNLALFGIVSILIVSGVIVSRYAVPAMVAWRPDAQTDYQWGAIHNRFSDLVVILAGLHLAINWDWSVLAARKIFGTRVAR